MIETGDPSGPRKAAGIQNVLNAFDCAAQQTIYVGDTDGDIVAIRKAGIPVVAAAWASTAEPEKLKQQNPDELFFSVTDFATWLLDCI